MMHLTKTAKRTIDRHRMLSPGDTVLVGVSGGPDSMALLYLLLDIRDSFGITLKIAHLNHGFRPEAAREAEFVSNVASSFKLDTVIRKIDVPAVKEEEGLSSQEAARNVRYAFFEETARETGADKIALAHTADDQAETVLMRLMRGAWLQGLSGIPPVREIERQKAEGGKQITIIRPLIDCSRKDVERFISERDIPFVTDSSNLKTDYLRNRIRLELIPFLQVYNPNIKETLVRTAELAGMDDEFLEGEAEKALIKCGAGDLKCGVQSLAIDFHAVKDLHPSIASRVVRKAIVEAKGDLKRISFQHISDILSLLKTGEGVWSLHLPGVTVSREHKKIIFKKVEGRR